MKWLVVFLFLMPIHVNAQTEDEFLPEVKLLVIDSTEAAVQRYCKEIISITTGYKSAFIDREDVMMSRYFYDNSNYESIKMEFQFGISELEVVDSTGLSTMKKARIVRLIRITSELNEMANIYNYLFNTTHTPEKILAISRYDKAVSYNGHPFNSTLVADDYKPGYWILSFYKL